MSQLVQELRWKILPKTLQNYSKKYEEEKGKDKINIFSTKNVNKRGYNIYGGENFSFVSLMDNPLHR